MTKQEILATLYREGEAVTPAQLASELHCKVNFFHKQLLRLLAQGLVARDRQKRYCITEAGRNFASCSDYYKFYEIGLRVCKKNLSLVQPTAEYIWGGAGQPWDLVWVWNRLREMLKPTTAKRWWNRWRLYLRKPVPEALAQKDAEAESWRAFIVGPDNVPLYVGKGLGLDYKDALDLCEIRKSKETQAQVQQTTLGDEVTKILRTFQVIRGKDTEKSPAIRKGDSPIKPPPKPPKSYVIKDTAKGIVIEEYVPGKPIVIEQKVVPPPPETYIVMDTPASPPEGPEGFALAPMAPVLGADGQSVYDKDGKPIYANMEAVMEWYSFQAGQRRAKEFRDALMGFAKTAGKTALTHLLH